MKKKSSYSISIYILILDSSDPFIIHPTIQPYFDCFFIIKKTLIIIIFSPFFSVGNYIFKYFFRFNLCHFVIYKSLKRSSSLWKFKKKTWFRGFVFLLFKKTSHDTFVTSPYIHASLYIQCYIVVSVLGKHWFLL